MRQKDSEINESRSDGARFASYQCYSEFRNSLYTSPATVPDIPFKLSVIDQHVYLQRGESEIARAVYEGTLGKFMRFVVPDYDAEFQVDMAGNVPKMNLRWNSDEELTKQ